MPSMHFLAAYELFRIAINMIVVWQRRIYHAWWCRCSRSSMPRFENRLTTSRLPLDRTTILTVRRTPRSRRRMRRQLRHRLKKCSGRWYYHNNHLCYPNARRGRPKSHQSRRSIQCARRVDGKLCRLWISHYYSSQWCRYFGKWATNFDEGLGH